MQWCLHRQITIPKSGIWLSCSCLSLSCLVLSCPVMSCFGSFAVSCPRLLHCSSLLRLAWTSLLRKSSLMTALKLTWLSINWRRPKWVSVALETMFLSSYPTPPTPSQHAPPESSNDATCFDACPDNRFWSCDWIFDWQSLTCVECLL